ncbi:MAG: hypothetical protein VW395_05145 [Methylotenera sp.]
MMSEQALIPNQILIGENLYTQAIDLILAKAQRRIWIFDQDLSRGGFASLTRYELLKSFLSTHIASELCIIVHDAAYFQQRCPRLSHLLRIYPHKMRVQVTDNSMKNFKACFIVVDGIHYVKRIHIDQARFKFGYSDKTLDHKTQSRVIHDQVIQSEILQQQFLELQTASPDTISSTVLGL